MKNQNKRNTEFNLSLNEDIIEIIWKNKVGKSFIMATGALVTLYILGKALRIIGTASNDYLHFRQSILRHKKITQSQGIALFVIKKNRHNEKNTYIKQEILPKIDFQSHHFKNVKNEKTENKGFSEPPKSSQNVH